MSRNFITGNASSWGAGIGASGDAIVRYNTVTGNVAGARGGGMVATGNTRVVSNVFFANHSPGFGGAIFAFSNFQGDPYVANNLLFDNSSGSGSGIWAEGVVTLVNNVITRNLAGSPIYVPSCCGETVLIDYNCIFNNGGGSWGSARPSDESQVKLQCLQ